MRENRFKWTGWGAFILLASYLVLVAYPMVWVGYTSLKEDREIFRDPFSLPSMSELHWENYSKTWVEARFSQYFLNSLVVTTASVAGVLLLGTMAAYALARFSFPGSQALFLLYMAGLMVPAQLSVIPLFFQMRDWGLLNTRSGLILVYIANGLPFAVFILTAFFRNLPGALHEAARIDGCTEWQAFRRVMLPLARPGLITVSVYRHMERIFFRLHAPFRAWGRERPNIAPGIGQPRHHRTVSDRLGHGLCRPDDGHCPAAGILHLFAEIPYTRHRGRGFKRVKPLGNLRV